MLSYLRQVIPIFGIALLRVKYPSLNAVIRCIEDAIEAVNLAE